MAMEMTSSTFPNSSTAKSPFAHSAKNIFKDMKSLPFSMERNLFGAVPNKHHQKNTLFPQVAINARRSYKIPYQRDSMEAKKIAASVCKVSYVSMIMEKDLLKNKLKRHEISNVEYKTKCRAVGCNFQKVYNETLDDAQQSIDNYQVTQNFLPKRGQNTSFQIVNDESNDVLSNTLENSESEKNEKKQIKPKFDCNIGSPKMNRASFIQATTITQTNNANILNKLQIHSAVITELQKQNEQRKIKQNLDHLISRRVISDQDDSKTYLGETCLMENHNFSGIKSILSSTSHNQQNPSDNAQGCLSMLSPQPPPILLIPSPRPNHRTLYELVKNKSLTSNEVDIMANDVLISYEKTKMQLRQRSVTRMHKSRRKAQKNNTLHLTM